MDLDTIASQADTPDDTSIREKYAEAVSGLEGAPPYDELTAESKALVLPSLHLAQASTSWESLIDYLSGNEELSSRPNNVHMAVYEVPEGSDGERGIRGFAVPQGYCRTLCDSVLAEYAASEVDDYGADVLAAWLRLLPLWGGSFGLSRAASTHYPEWYWAPIRMMIAGAGFDHWHRLASMCADTPGCPFDPDQSSGSWKKETLDAHKLCGWPIHLAHIPYPLAAAWSPAVPPSERPEFPPQWCKPLAYLHVLKHVRLDPDGNYRVLYHGTAARIIPAAKAGNLLGCAQLMDSFLNALGMTAPEIRSRAHEPYDALRSALRKTSTNSLLPTAPLADLPTCLFAGEWTHLEPDPAAGQDFLAHGLRINGIKVAQNGKIRPAVTDGEDVMAWAWNIHNATSPEALRAKAESYDPLPDTYQAGLPMDLFCAAFPNIEIPYAEHETAYKALLEAPLFASVIRDRCSWLHYEYPFFAVLPAWPSQDKSTNNGKTSAVDTIAGAMAPGLRSLSAPDSTSAPDTRSVAAVFRQYGSVALDEFVLPRARTHPLHRSNLQTLCTGRQVNSGLVGENEGYINLTNSIVIGAKFLELPEDLINRSLVLFLGELDDEMRANWEQYERIQDGTLALEMRLSALAFTEKEGFLEKLESLPRNSEGVMRFGGHKAIAALLYMLRTGINDVEEAMAAVMAAHRNMIGRFRGHTEIAEDEGLIQEAQDGPETPLRLSTLMQEIRPGDVQLVRDYCEANAVKNGDKLVWRPKALLHGILEALDLGGRDLASTMTVLVGGPGGVGRWTEMKVLRAFSRELKRLRDKDQFRVIPLPGDLRDIPWVIAPDGQQGYWAKLDKVGEEPILAPVDED